MPTGASLAYVAATGARPYPRAHDRVRTTAHQPQPPKPTGLDWDALAPTCTRCGTRSADVHLETGLCPTCSGETPKPKAKGKRTGYAAAQLPQDEIVRRFTAPVSGPDDHVRPDALQPDTEIVEDATELPRNPAATEPAYTPEANLEAQIQHAATVLRDTATSTNYAVQILRTNALGALEALHLVHEITQTPAPAGSPRAAGAGPTRPAAGTGKGKPTRRPATTPRAGANPVDETQVIAEYQAGDTPPTIARRHGCGPTRIRNILDRHGIERRDDRTKSGGKNRITLTDDVAETLRRLYVADQLTVTEVGEHLGHSRTTTTRLLREAGIELRPAAHESGTQLTAEQEQKLVDRYVAGAALHDLAREHHIRVTAARDLITAAGHQIRPKGASHRNREAMAALGVTAAQVRAWAVEQGLAQPGTAGLIPMRLIDAYAAAHPQEDHQ